MTCGKPGFGVAQLHRGQHFVGKAGQHSVALAGHANCACARASVVPLWRKIPRRTVPRRMGVMRLAASRSVDVGYIVRRLKARSGRRLFENCCLLIGAPHSDRVSTPVFNRWSRVWGYYATRHDGATALFPRSGGSHAPLFSVVVISRIVRTRVQNTCALGSGSGTFRRRARHDRNPPRR